MIFLLENIMDAVSKYLISCPCPIFKAKQNIAIRSFSYVPINCLGKGYALLHV